MVDITRSFVMWMKGKKCIGIKENLKKSVCFFFRKIFVPAFHEWNARLHDNYTISEKKIQFVSYSIAAKFMSHAAHNRTYPLWRVFFHLYSHTYICAHYIISAPLKQAKNQNSIERIQSAVKLVQWDSVVSVWFPIYYEHILSYTMICNTIIFRYYKNKDK